MKRKLFFFILFALLPLLWGTNFAQSYAQNETGTLVQTSFLEVVLNFVIVLAVCGCFFYTKKIESFLRGGELSFAWFLIVISFFLLFFLQLIRLGSSMNIFNFDSALYSFFKLVWIALLGIGIYQLRKLLS